MATLKQEKKLTREEYKAQQELEAARKAGTAAPELDIEGKMINPHIPQYISQAPWYLNQNHAGLQHQKFKKEKLPTGLDEWYQRGEKKGAVPVKFKKGACENCGSTTHKKKDCTERPRKKGARFTGEDLQRDDVIVNMDHLDFASKRDQWNGYNPADYQKVLKEYENLEKARIKLKEETVQNEMLTTEDDNQDDEDKGYTEAAPMVGTAFDAKKRITVRNLRIREHTAKFLLNTDVNSAYYDPKTRSMRGNPYANVPGGDPNYVTENFMRTTGDALDVMKSQVFSWNAKESEQLSLQSNPTKTEIMRKKHETEHEDESNKTQKSILDKYGGEQHLDAPPMELLLGQTDHYIEYDRSGKVIKGEEKVTPKSRYPEDVLNLNHREIWGSYWEEGNWGYACCHSTVYSAYCVGEIGKRAKQNELASKKLEAAKKKEEEPQKSLLEMHQDEQIRSYSKKSKKEKKSKKDKKSKRDCEKEEEEKKKKDIERSLRKLKEADLEGERELKSGDRKRKYNSGSSRDVDDSLNPTEADMEAYRLSKRRAEDPMANFK